MNRFNHQSSTSGYEKHENAVVLRPLSFSNTLNETPYHDYGIYLTSDWKRRDIVICDSDSANSPLYFASMSQTVRKKIPEVRLYAVQHVNIDTHIRPDTKRVKINTEQTKAGELLAVAHFPCWSKSIEMGFGSPVKQSSVRWETIRVAKIGVHEFSMPTPSQSEQYSNPFSDSIEDAKPSAKEKRMYQWRRTHSRVDDGLQESMEARRKLVNDKGEIVALFIPNAFKGLSLTGTLRIFKEPLGGASDAATGIDKEMEIRIILTRCAIAEKLRR